MIQEDPSKGIMRYEIDQSGYVETKRPIKDGFVYIGTPSVIF